MKAPAARAPGVVESWRRLWPQALAAWSAYTMLREPRFLEDAEIAAEEGMAGQIASIRLCDQAVMINAAEIRARGLEPHGLAILAHEIGHHVYVPGNLTDNGRMVAAMGRILTGLPQSTVLMAANLYGDLLINDRLQRRAGVDVAAVYRQLKAGAGPGGASSVWRLYSRTYEHLWRLSPGTLTPPDVDAETDADAMLLARMIRSFAGDWLRGARRFATVLYRYLARDEEARRRQTLVVLGLHDTDKASAPMPGGEPADAIPDGLTEVDPSEMEDDSDFDREFDDPLRGEEPADAPKSPPRAPGRGRPGAQCRQPFEYGALLKSLGLDIPAQEVTARYYRERAIPHLIPFPSRRAPAAREPLAEGYAPWDASEDLEGLDLFGSVLQSPRVIPGTTTVQRVYGDAPGFEPARIPVDLDIYVDCSGSMPNPSVEVSYLALAATILSLSALRAGARVQATLWSSAGLFETTGGFIRDERRIVATVTGYVSGGTAFPLHILRDTYLERKPSDPPVHIVVISDDGCDTMLAHDEQRNSGAAIAAAALQKARGGGTLVLNLPDASRWTAAARFEELGFRIHAVRAWEELVAFARAFVRENYGDGP